MRWYRGLALLSHALSISRSPWRRVHSGLPPNCHAGASSPRLLHRSEIFVPARNLATVSCKRRTTTPRSGVKSIQHQEHGLWPQWFSTVTKNGPSLRLRINWKWPESVFLVLTKRKADSGGEIGVKSASQWAGTGRECILFLINAIFAIWTHACILSICGLPSCKHSPSHHVNAVPNQEVWSRYETRSGASFLV